MHPDAQGPRRRREVPRRRLADAARAQRRWQRHAAALALREWRVRAGVAGARCLPVDSVVV